MSKRKIKIEYVQAIRGKKRIHIRYPGAGNDVTWCRFSSNFVPAKKEDGVMCKFCQHQMEKLSVVFDYD